MKYGDDVLIMNDYDVSTYLIVFLKKKIMINKKKL